MEVLRKYGVATTVIVPLIDRGTQDFESTPATFAAGDIKIIKDEAASANTTNLPTHEGHGIYSLALTAAEMQAARIAITWIDLTATKLWEDQGIILSTYGHASAQHAFDLDTATQTVTASTVSDKTGYALSTAGVDAIGDDVYEGTLTQRQIMRILLAAIAEKSAGGGTTTITFRDNADTKNRISATVDSSGNRTAITLDGT